MFYHLFPSLNAAVQLLLALSDSVWKPHHSFEHQTLHMLELCCHHFTIYIHVLLYWTLILTSGHLGNEFNQSFWILDICKNISVINSSDVHLFIKHFYFLELFCYCSWFNFFSCLCNPLNSIKDIDRQGYFSCSGTTFISDLSRRWR